MAGKNHNLLSPENKLFFPLLVIGLIVNPETDCPIIGDTTIEHKPVIDAKAELGAILLELRAVGLLPVPLEPLDYLGHIPRYVTTRDCRKDDQPIWVELQEGRRGYRPCSDISYPQVLNIVSEAEVYAVKAKTLVAISTTCVSRLTYQGFQAFQP
jgi:hypothetical protein